MCYRLFSIQRISTTKATTSIQSSSTTLDIACINSVCICIDNLGFYSTIQQKCINCRPGWLPYKNVCYKSFSELRKWADYVTYCASLNSTLLIADDHEKFNFFRNVSKNIPKIGSNTRTFVNAKITTANVYEWMNNKPINTSYFMSGIYLAVDYCFAYSSTANYLLATFTSSGTANGICEYSE